MPLYRRACELRGQVRLLPRASSALPSSSVSSGPASALFVRVHACPSYERSCARALACPPHVHPCFLGTEAAPSSSTPAGCRRAPCGGSAHAQAFGGRGDRTSSTREGGPPRLRRTGVVDSTQAREDAEVQARVRRGRELLGLVIEARRSSGRDGGQFGVCRGAIQCHVLAGRAARSVSVGLSHVPAAFMCNVKVLEPGLIALVRDQWGVSRLARWLPLCVVVLRPATTIP